MNEYVNLSGIVRADSTAGDNYIATAHRISWTTNDKCVCLLGLPESTYILHEDCAPAGYNVADDLVFVMRDGVLCDENGVPFPGGVITMFDSYMSDPPLDSPSTPPSARPSKSSRVGGDKDSPQTSDPYSLYRGTLILAFLIAAFTGLTALRRRQKQD